MVIGDAASSPWWASVVLVLLRPEPGLVLMPLSSGCLKSSGVEERCVGNACLAHLGVDSTGSRPLTSRHCLAALLPSRRQCSISDTRWGTTSVRMGMGGRYLATRWAVTPACMHAAGGMRHRE